MKSFLAEIAEKLVQENKNPGDLTVVFPNRRAILYFRKFLSEQLNAPTFAPRLLTIEEFISGFSEATVPDRIDLVHALYSVYRGVVGTDESFDQFYFWGEMLLRDFEEIDKYLVDAGLLFKSVKDQKELDVLFDYFTEEQLSFLRSFWLQFDGDLTKNKQSFLNIWRSLFAVYENFRSHLREKNRAYEGMIHRDVAERIRRNDSAIQPSGKLMFVGFNALTTSEETILSHFVASHQATVYWDTDHYYLNNHNQEAGKFLRMYQQDQVLGRTFPTDIPAHFKTKEKLNLYGAPTPVGQVKLLAQVLDEQIRQGLNPEEALVVLPDEKLMLPVLHSLADVVPDMNVTMGFPLSGTPVFNLIELLIELQLNARADGFSHRQVVPILGHPYIVATDPQAAQERLKRIKKENRVTVAEAWLHDGPPVYRLIFKKTGGDRSELIGYIRSVLQQLAVLNGLGDLDKEYIYHFITFLNRVGLVLGGEKEESQRNPDVAVNVYTSKEARASQQAFLRLFRQLTRFQRIPFSGEPLKGLQIMGVLETRNLDFKHVFILSLNEGIFPAASSKGSYVPHTLRKAFGLPTVDHNDAIYAYLFYRVIQRAENVHLFYNAEPDLLGQGEKSRLLQQLIYESGLPIAQHVLHNPVQPHPIEPVVVAKDERVYKSLARFCDGPAQQNELTPSALNDYLDCRLRFYFRYVAGIREPREVEEELDARVLGNLLHNVMEKLYRDIMNRKGTAEIEASDLKDIDPLLSRLIDEVFIEQYSLDKDKKVVYEGQRLVVREVVNRFIRQIIKMDMAFAPFTIEALEEKDLRYMVRLNEAGKTVVLGGRVDRADRKAAPGKSGKDMLRVIDYKAGRDVAEIKTIEELFTRNTDRNKAAFQVLLYALLFRKKYPSNDVRVTAGLINRVNLFDEDFRFGVKIGKEVIDDVDPYIGEFEQRLYTVLDELFDPGIPFDQTTNTKSCRICSYRQVCYR